VPAEEQTTFDTCAAIGDSVSAQTLHQTIGEAQAACRTENEAIQASADHLTMLGPIPFICECPDSDCFEIVRLTFDQYEAIREYPRRFFNVSGHERTSVEAGAERIVAVAGDLTVVEKIGIAGAVATHTHARPT
jgi:hypothetical protein